ncbi:MAG: ABC transporter permease [Chloroflexia bacterium]|nr:ABC transporter permease [Chloroflexia bacterium]
MEALGDDSRLAGATLNRRPAWQRWLVPLARHEEVSLFVLFLVVSGFFAVLEPGARRGGTYLDLLRDASPNLIAAVGLTLLLLCGEFDLSIGAMLAFTGVVTVSVFNATDNMWLGILAGLLTGPLVGFINGYLVTFQGMNSLMTTLGMMFALRGLVYVWTNKTPIVDENGFRDFTRLYQAEIGPVPVPGILSLILIAVVYVVMTRTQFGRNIYAIGGNPTAARVSGIRVERTKLLLFVLSGTTAAIAGLVVASQTGTGYFDAGVQGFELIVIASAVLGGVSLAGGEGRLVSAMLGVLILGMTGKGMRLMNVHITQQLVVTGIVMLIAVYLHGARKRLLESDRRSS